MKTCPKCQTQYDEEIVRFCTKDGSPLVEENPSFTEIPSQSSIDEIGEETVIGRKRPAIPEADPVGDDEQGARVVIPIGDEVKAVPVRPLESPQRPYDVPQQSNTVMVVLLTIFGTVIILGGAAGLWWLLSGRGDSVANTNVNANVNSTNNNANLLVNYNSNISDFLKNANANENLNANVNANSDPSPTKTPTPKPSPTIDENSNTDLNLNSNTVVNISPSNSNSSSNSRITAPAPTLTPKPSPVNTTPGNVNVGVMNSRAKDLRKPAYPPIAKQIGASGKVEVQVSIDESGNVVNARAISGHPLLRVPAESAARQSSFYPVKMGERTVRANGTVVYNFINQ